MLGWDLSVAHAPVWATLRQRRNNFQDLVPRKAQPLHQRNKGVFALLVKAAQHTHQDLLHLRAVPGAVATPHLPRYHRRPDAARTYRSPLPATVGPFQTRTVQKREQVSPVVAQMLRQPLIA